jgi:factor associated with neutral sphingomyelinase activation
VDSDTLSNYSAKSEGFRGLSMEFVSRIMALASPPPEIPVTETSPVPSSSVKFQIPSDVTETSPVSSSSVKFQIPSDVTETSSVPSASVKFQIPLNDTTNPLPETPVRPRRKIRAGTPLPANVLKHAAQLTSSDSDTEGSPIGKSHDDEYVESSERDSQGVCVWRTGSAVSSSDLDFPESNDPFDIVNNVEMVLPSKLRKSHLRNSTESIVVQRLEPDKLERCDPKAGVAPQKLEKDNKTMVWYSMFRQRLSEPQSLKLHRSPVNACILSEENAAGSVTMYSVDKDGFIKVGFSYICSSPGIFSCNALSYYLFHQGHHLGQ